MKTLLVTGATGFLGGAVARDLHGRGLRVRATGRNRAQGERLRAEGIKFVECDLAGSAQAVGDLVRGCDAVVHCAAMASPWGAAVDFESANVAATGHVVAACQRQQVKRLVHVSSPSVLFDFADQRGLKEDAPWTAAPANHYIATKRASELLVRAAHRETGLPAIVLRPQGIFGAGDPTLLPRILRVARRGYFPRFRDEPTLLDLVWIGDAAQAVRLALEAGAELNGRVYSVTSGDPQPFDSILDTVFKAYGLNVRSVGLPFVWALRLATALEWISNNMTGSRWEPPLTRYSVGAITFTRTCDIGAARRDLGYAPSGAVLDKLAALQP